MSQAPLTRFFIRVLSCLIWHYLHVQATGEQQFTVLDGYKVNDVLQQVSARTITECSVKVLKYLTAHNKYLSATYDRQEKICGVSDVLSITSMTQHGDSSFATILPRHARSCADVALLYQHKTNGEYIIMTTDGSDITVFCQFDGQAGYTFLSRLDINNEDMAALYTDPSRGVLLRHLASGGSQSDVHLKQTAYWENRANITIEVKVSPMRLQVTFVPVDQFGAGVINGVFANGIEHDYMHCGGNNNNSVLLFSFENLWSFVNTLFENKGIGAAVYNLSVASPVTIPSMYFGDTLINFGGCGALGNNEHFSVTGTAIGIPFTLA